MNKLEKVRYILTHNQEIFNWYCKESFDMPEPDDLTYADVMTYGTGYWGDIADLIIEDGINAGVIKDDE